MRRNRVEISTHRPTGAVSMPKVNPQRHEAAGLQGPAAPGDLRRVPRDGPKRGRLRLRPGAVLLTAPTIAMCRTRAIGVENVPVSGPVILTPNHFSQMDHFFAAVYLRRKVQFMAKSQLFTHPFIKWVFRNGGVFTVRRGYDDQKAFKTAEMILERGGTVLMYAEGGRSRSGDLGEPKRGVGKIALESGAPVVPVAIHGSAHARGWKRLQLPEGDDPVRRASLLPGQGEPEPRGAAAGRQPGLRPRPRDVRRSRGEGPPRRSPRSARRPAGDHA